jgi:hypothetical protein
MAHIRFNPTRGFIPAAGFLEARGRPTDVRDAVFQGNDLRVGGRRQVLWNDSIEENLAWWRKSGTLVGLKAASRESS